MNLGVPRCIKMHLLAAVCHDGTVCYIFRIRWHTKRFQGKLKNGIKPDTTLTEHLKRNPVKSRYTTKNLT